MDDILVSNVEDTSDDSSTGCSTLMVNIPCKGQVRIDNNYCNVGGISCWTDPVNI